MSRSHEMPSLQPPAPVGSVKIEKKKAEPTLSSWQRIVQKDGLVRMGESRSVKDVPKQVALAMKRLWNVMKEPEYSFVFSRLKQSIDSVADPGEKWNMLREAMPFFPDEDERFARRELATKILKEARSDMALRTNIARQMLAFSLFRYDAMDALREASKSGALDADAHEGYADGLMLECAESVNVVNSENASGLEYKMVSVIEKYDQAKRSMLDLAMGYRRGISEDVKKRVEALELKRDQAERLRREAARYEQDPANFADYEAAGDRSASSQEKNPAKAENTSALSRSLLFYERARKKISQLVSRDSGLERRLADVDQKIATVKEMREKINNAVSFCIREGDLFLWFATRDNWEVTGEGDAVKNTWKSARGSAVESRLHDIRRAIRKYHDARKSPELNEMPIRKMHGQFAMIDKKIATAEAIKKQLEERMEEKPGNPFDVSA